MYIISRCLLGDNCKYDGGNNYNEDVVEFCKTHSYVCVCPEEAAWLGTPREPAEIVDNTVENFKVVNKLGEDVTADFFSGATWSMKAAKLEVGTIQEELEGTILKENSPSCGYGKIYDGTFSGRLKDGNGVFTELLIDDHQYLTTGGWHGAEGFKYSENFKIANEKNFKEVFGIK